MKKRQLASAISLFALGGLAFGHGMQDPVAAGGQGGRQAMPPPSVAVVDVQELFNRCPQWGAMKVRLQAEGDGLKVELDELQGEMVKLKARMDGKASGTMDYAQDNLRLRGMSAEYEGMMTIFDQEMARQQALGISELYAIIDAAVQKVAAQRNLELVLRVHQRPDPKDSLNVQQAMMEARVVLHHAKRLDITPAVLGVMQAEFNGARGAAEAAANKALNGPPAAASRGKQPR